MSIFPQNQTIMTKNCYNLNITAILIVLSGAKYSEIPRKTKKMFTFVTIYLAVWRQYWSLQRAAFGPWVLCLNPSGLDYQSRTTAVPPSPQY